MSFLMHGIITLSDAMSYDKIKVEEETNGYKKNSFWRIMQLSRKHILNHEVTYKWHCTEKHIKQ